MLRAPSIPQRDGPLSPPKGKKAPSIPQRGKLIVLCWVFSVKNNFDYNEEFI